MDLNMTYENFQGLELLFQYWGLPYITLRN